MLGDGRGAMTSDAVRWVRALTLASVLFTGGLAGHAAADDLTPAVPVLIPLFVLTVVAMGPFVGAPLNLARTIALLFGGQVLLHTALQLLGRSAATGMTTSARGAAPLLAPSSHPMSCHMMSDPGARPSAGFAMPLLGGQHLIMLLAHLAAAIAVGVWLLAGERVLWSLLAVTARPVVNAWRLVWNVVCDRAGAMSSDFSRVLADWCPELVARSSMWTTGVMSRRGPPGAVSPGARGCTALSMI